MTQVTVALRSDGTATPYATLTQFTRISGSDTAGTWESTSAADLPLTPVIDLDVSVADQAGDQVTLPAAGTIRAHVPTRFDSFSVTPTTIGVDRTPPAFSGRLVYTDAQGQTQPAAGMTVRVTDDGGHKTETTTSSDGSFSGTAPAENAPTDYWATAVAQGGLTASRTARIPVTVDRFPSRIIGLTLDPAQPHLNQSVTISGTLEYQDANGAWHPAPSTAVSALADGAPPNSNLRLWARTGNDGTFDMTQDFVPADGTWTIAHDPTLENGGLPSRAFDPYAASQSTVTVADPAHLTSQTKLSITPASDYCYYTGMRQPVALEGLLSGVQWGEPITLQFSPDGTTWSDTPYHGTTDQAIAQAENGYADYRIPVVVTQSGWWRASYAGSAHATPSVSSPFLIRLGPEFTVKLTVGSGQSHPVPGGRISFDGTAVQCIGSGYNAPPGGDPADLQYSPDGKSWKTVVKDRFYNAGNFYFSARTLGTGYWRAYVPRYKTYSPAIRVTVKRTSRITGAAVNPNPVRRGHPVRLRGVLQGTHTGWYGLSGATVQVWFRAKGTQTAILLGTARTDGSGRFAFTTTAHHTGAYWFSYAGSRLYWPTTGHAVTETVK
ncbi:hypothetical protein [Actinoallomurus vinaceus]|uniref:hypothetical protein n=1 Tax=Actinoallomurus vinaceus TaxID=1080074 RepID=UPI0031E90A16